MRHGRRAPWRGHWHHALLLGWLAVSGVVYARHGEQSWHFLVTGARTLLCLQGATPALRSSVCGLHVYAVHPELQIGPLSLLATGPAVLLGPVWGSVLARVGMLLAGWVILLLIERGDVLSGAEGPGQLRRLKLRVLLVGMVFMPAWADLAVGFGHLDDVLALLFTAVAGVAVVSRRPRTTGWALAAAILSKPWAVAFLPLLLALPRGSRRRSALYALLPVVGVVAIFVLADPGTLHAAGFRIQNAAASSLRVLGVTDSTPPWDRPVQFGLGLVLGCWAVRLGRWRAVVMIAAATRIMLDPQVYSYYTASVLVGTAIWDIQVRRGRVYPLWTWATFGALFVSRYAPISPATLGVLRLTICVVLIACALFAPGLLGALGPHRRRPPGSQDGNQDGGSGGALVVSNEGV